jgi:DNA-binding LytR/AlgR family response regulator
MADEQKSAPSPKILIVEDEMLIADTVRMNLERHGYVVVDTAISYEEAIGIIKKECPDLVLLDIRLRGNRTGVDVANYLRTLPQPPPFIYLTSQMDDCYLELAKLTYPAAYLGKPIQMSSLLGTLKMVLFNVETYRKAQQTITLRHQGTNFVVGLGDICYLEADHVYVRVVLQGGRAITQRGAIKDFVKLLSGGCFVHVHRSYIVNLKLVTGYDVTGVFFGKKCIPISRSRRREVMEMLHE